jgi:predicted nucleotidyltransferase
LIDISESIDELTVAVLEGIRMASNHIGVPFFVVGATARDMILRHAFHHPIRRATKDIDIAIRATSWDEYDQMVKLLISMDHFSKTAHTHRLIFEGKTIVDLIPFGDIAGPKQEIVWPTTEGNVMVVFGFEDAYRAAEIVTIRKKPQLEVSVATLAGLAVLKLISWRDGYPTRSRDAEDFHFIAEAYLDAGNDIRLYEDASDLRSTEDFDLTMIGGRLLGRDMSRIVSPETRGKIRDIFNRETNREGALRLAGDIIGRSFSLQESAEDVFALLEQVRFGFNEQQP